MKDLLNKYPRKSPEQWIIQGLIQMQYTAFSDLKMEETAKALKLTRGSFYHHFKNKNDYLEQVLKFWERETTEKGLKIIPSFKGSIRDKLRQTELFLHESNILKIERSIRQSISSSMVQSYFEKMDPLRIAMMAQFFIDEGCALNEAEFKSRMIYNIQIAEVAYRNDFLGPLPLSELEQRLDFYLA